MIPPNISNDNLRKAFCFCQDVIDGTMPAGIYHDFLCDIDHPLPAIAYYHHTTKSVSEIYSQGPHPYFLWPLQTITVDVFPYTPSPDYGPTWANYLELDDDNDESEVPDVFLNYLNSPEIQRQRFNGRRGIMVWYHKHTLPNEALADLQQAILHWLHDAQLQLLGEHMVC